MKVRVRVVIAAAAVASIATSYPPPTVTGEMPPTSLQRDQVFASYAIHTEVTTSSIDSLYGRLRARVSIELPAGGNIEAMTVSLRLAGHADIADSKTYDSIGTTEFDVVVDAWTSCTTSPCAEDFELTIQRAGTNRPQVVAVSGDLELEAAGADENQSEPTLEISLPAISVAPAR